MAAVEQALSEKADAKDVAAALGRKANASTVGGISTRINALEADIAGMGSDG